MKILVVGGGGREHALVWRLARAGHELVAAPGNPGIARDARCLSIPATDGDSLQAAAADEQVDLVVIGPEAPLVAGLADRLRAANIPVFGPSSTAAQLEGSKSFCKQFFARHGIRTSEFEVADSVAEADAAIDRLGADVVVKADGLAAGKGVVVCSSVDQAKAAARDMLEGKAFGAAGDRIVVERKVIGQELSVMAITDGNRYEVLAQAEDHKAIFDGDEGPNTGGMGTVSPAPWATDELIDRIRREVFDRTIAGLAADELDYRGVLYAGLMIDADGVPWMLEYNCRFGDPETQPVMCRWSGDPGAWLAGAANGALPDGSIEWDPRTAVCVVMASQGYPEQPVKGDPISGLDQVEADDLVVFHAGTRREADQLVTSGGRVLGVTALAEGVDSARRRAYEAVRMIQFRGAQYRTDIGARTR
jgi:phosphoribosylamine--glycine ligase